MRELTIEDIKANPNNVLLQPLPENPSVYLLLLAQIAATCIRAQAEVTIDEFRNGRGAKFPEENLAGEEWHRAHQKIGEICFILRDEYGIPIFDFCLSRHERCPENIVTRVQGFFSRLLS